MKYRLTKKERASALETAWSIVQFDLDLLGEQTGWTAAPILPEAPNTEERLNEIEHAAASIQVARRLYRSIKEDQLDSDQAKEFVLPASYALEWTQEEYDTTKYWELHPEELAFEVTAKDRDAARFALLTWIKVVAVIRSAAN
jgi:hypothetical protein